MSFMLVQESIPQILSIGWVTFTKNEGQIDLTDQMNANFFVASSFTLTETNSSPLKIDPWKRRFLLETTIFRASCQF